MFQERNINDYSLYKHCDEHYFKICNNQLDTLIVATKDITCIDENANDEGLYLTRTLDGLLCGCVIGGGRTGNGESVSSRSE